MRIGIRVQLGLLVLLAAIVPLAVLSIAVWFNNRDFVISVTSKELSLTASLKAAEIAADILLLESTCATIVTRILLQEAIKDFYQGNLSADNWTAAENDVSGALASGGLSALLQVKIFSRNGTGNPYGLLNVTANLTDADIALPAYTYPNGTHYNLGDAGLGYPPPLYPNITYVSTNMTDPSDPTTNGSLASAFPDFPLNSSSILFLGPLQVNSTYAMVSLTLPMIDNTDKTTVLGYMTVVAAATSLIDVATSREGLGDTGIVLLVGPNRRENHFKYADRPATVDYKPNVTELNSASVKYVFPPQVISGQSDRHSTYNSQIMASVTNSSNFSMGSYPAAVVGFSRQSQAVNNASSTLSTHNENGASVAVGYARPDSPLVDWLLIIEQAHSEAWGPIINLRNIILACVFGTIGVVLFLTIPVVHYSIAPIRRLRDATEKSIAPPGDTPNGSIRSERLDGVDDYTDEEIGDEENAGNISQTSKKKLGFFVRMRRLRRNGRRKSSKTERTEEERRRAFKIPGKVQDRKHFIKDELTDLTTTFNEMTDELMGQYERLEEKVAQRTQELEISKKAAEAANESKTLFIANISHELKTPLNGILGMCAVCMGEEDLPKIKRSLQVVYKSGDLLLHLLNDLLTFSKNQIGQQLSLEEKEFRLSDVKTQLRTIFDKQIREGHINFSVKYVSADSIDMSPDMQLSEKELPAIGPHGLGRLKDMCLWGDQHRILQVIINLVSNSLKFTPEGGTVAVRIKCLGEAESPDGSRNSMGSKDSSRRGSRTSRNRHRHGSGSNNSQNSKSGHSNGIPKQAGTALVINPMDPNATAHVQVRDRSRTPPPPGAKTLIFEFEVEDTGPGIPEHLQQTVFEPFVQGDLGLSKKYGGTGLGLSICSQLATLMGGGITLDSSPGKGSRFIMKIPLKFVKERAPSTSSMGSDPQVSRPGSRPLSVTSVTADRNSGAQIGGDSTPTLAPAKPLNFEKDKQPRLVGLSQPFFAAATTPSPSPGSEPEKQLAALEHVAAAKGPEAKLRVLVAEDNLVNQEVVLRMLKLEDIYDVVVAKDGQEAYDMVKQSMDKGQYFNLIFMDIQMPNLDGLQSTRLIRQMGYSAPIVALTAFSEESNVKECYASGMDMFLSKPIRRPALKQVLKKFATIPEETETTESGSLTRKSTPENETPKPTNEAGPSQPSQPPLNVGATTTGEY